MNISNLSVDNRFGQLPGIYYSRVQPTPVPNPWLVCASADAAALLDLPVKALYEPRSIDILGGNASLPGGDPLAMVYAGHQFGNYVPQLGDGRALLLGQARNRQGESWDIQLKGSGRTPYSRWADGRAVLRSCIREFLGSEAMHHLGIPTTRALCVIGSSLPVERETMESGAVMARLAPSHVRFGHFEYFYYRREIEPLAPLADHVIDEHFPELAGAPDRYIRWLEAVTERTARLIAQWQGVGFVHGVMNTDNMSVLGLTIDYGPYAFMETFIPDYAPNHTDHAGRYAYDQQPAVGQWNISRLLQACLPLLSDTPDDAVERAEGIMEGYRASYQRAYHEITLAKLGLTEDLPDNHDLVQELFACMDQGQTDFTGTFRALCGIGRDPGQGDTGLLDVFVDRDVAAGWLHGYRQRLNAERHDDQERQAAMRRQNPCYVPRTHLLQAAIERAEAGDGGEVQRLLACLRRPYEERPDCTDLLRPDPAGGRGIELSCSS